MNAQLVANLANCFDFTNARSCDLSNYIFSYLLVINELTLNADIEAVVFAIHCVGSLQRAKCLDKPLPPVKIEKFLKVFNMAKAKPIDGKLLIEGLVPCNFIVIITLY